MKRLLFYCQHILGIGHLIRSMEIVRGLTRDFEVCFINGGEIFNDFPLPPGVDVVNLPAIKTDAEFRELQPVDGDTSIDALMEIRRDQMLQVLHRFQPDVLMVELFPFGRRRFSAELVPLLEAARAIGTKTVCSLRDIVVTKQDQAKHEEKVCRLMNRHFDQLLVHGDPNLMPLEASFSRVADLTCEVHYTGYVVQSAASERPEVQAALKQFPDTELNATRPYILVSVGGGRFGHELLRAMAQVSVVLERQIPHQIRMFAGPFSPPEVFSELTAIAQHQKNLTVERYTPDLLLYMKSADLSVSMGGYNTTMNVLTTGVRSLLLPFTGNDDQEQMMRVQRLHDLEIVTRIWPEDLQPSRLASLVLRALGQRPHHIRLDLSGVEKTATLVRSLCTSQPQPAAV
jgi:predicted glycosyltransferase